MSASRHTESSCGTLRPDECVLMCGFTLGMFFSVCLRERQREVENTGVLYMIKLHLQVKVRCHVSTVYVCVYCLATSSRARNSEGFFTATVVCKVHTVYDPG